MRYRLNGILFLALLCAACSKDPSQDTTTQKSLRLIAGGLGGTGTTDGIGPAARFGSDPGLAVDFDGHLYVADNRLVRRVVVASGEVTTLAGDRSDPGQTVPTGVDGVGSAARFVTAKGIVFDRAGSLFVSDEYDHTIRKVVIATGAVTTLAGMYGMSGRVDGVGSAARFSRPRGLALDSQGNLFIADSQNSVIRRVDPRTGAVTTVTPGVGLPYGVWVDTAGNVFVADRGGSIFKFNPATGGQTVLAGDPLGTGGCMDGTGDLARFSTPTSLAMDDSGDLLVADSGCGTIRKVSPTTRAVTTVLGSAQMRGFINGPVQAARFVLPSQLARDVAGNLYISDGTTLRRFSPGSGSVSTLAGVGTMAGAMDGVGAAARFSSPNAVAALTPARLLIADRRNFTIRQLDLSSGEVSTLAGTVGMPRRVDGIGAAAGFASPTDIAADRNGQVFVADGIFIRQLVPSTKEVSTLAGSSTFGGTDGVGAAASFTDICGIVADDQGNLYVSESYASTIRKVVVATRTVTTLAGSYTASGALDGIGTAARFNSPCGLAWDPAGRLLIADARNQTIRALDLSTNAVTTLAGSAGVSGSSDGPGNEARFNVPVRLALDIAGLLYVSDAGNSLVRTLELSTGQVRTLVGVPGQRQVILGPLPAGLNQPSGLAVLPSRELIIVDVNENAVLSVR